MNKPSFGGDTDGSTTVGGHVKAGLEYFIIQNLALNSELKLIFSGSSDVTVTGVSVGNYNPTSFSGLFGFRYLF